MKKKAPKPEPKAQVSVHNPDDEPIVQPYGGHEFVLAPETATEIVSPLKDGTTADHIANFIVDKWGAYGVYKITPDMSEGDLKLAQQRSEDAYLQSTLKWASEAIKAGSKVAIEAKNHGMPPPAKSSNHQRAKAWLSRNTKRLQAAGLIQ